MHLDSTLHDVLTANTINNVKMLHKMKMHPYAGKEEDVLKKLEGGSKGSKIYCKSQGS